MLSGLDYFFFLLVALLALYFERTPAFCDR